MHSFAVKNENHRTSKGKSLKSGGNNSYSKGFFETFFFLYYVPSLPTVLQVGKLLLGKFDAFVDIRLQIRQRNLEQLFLVRGNGPSTVNLVHSFGLKS